MFIRWGRRAAEQVGWGVQDEWGVTPAWVIISSSCVVWVLVTGALNPSMLGSPQW